MMHLGLKIIEIWKFYLSIQNICTQQDHCFASGYVECNFIMTRKNYFRDSFQIKLLPI